MNLGEKIKLARKEKKITQQELANKIGKSKSTIEKYEADKVENIPYETLEKISNVLDISIEELLPIDVNDWISNSILMDFINTNNFDVNELENILNNDPNVIGEFIKSQTNNKSYNKKLDNLMIFHRIKIILKTFNIDFVIRDDEDMTVVLVDKTDNFSIELPFKEFSEFTYRLHWLIEKEIEYFKLSFCKEYWEGSKVNNSLDKLMNEYKLQNNK